MVLNRDNLNDMIPSLTYGGRFIYSAHCIFSCPSRDITSIACFVSWRNPVAKLLQDTRDFNFGHSQAAILRHFASWRLNSLRLLRTIAIYPRAKHLPRDGKIKQKWDVILLPWSQDGLHVLASPSSPRQRRCAEVRDREALQIKTIGSGCLLPSNN